MHIYTKNNHSPQEIRPAWHIVFNNVYKLRIYYTTNAISLQGFFEYFRKLAKNPPTA